MVWVQRQGDGHYRMHFGRKGPADFSVSEGFDLSLENAVKRRLLRDEQFGGHTSQVKAMIEAATGPFCSWPLYYFPPEDLS
jgi:hypothetical protein